MSFIHGLLEKSVILWHLFSFFSSSKEVRERKRKLLERDYSETEEVLNVYLEGIKYVLIYKEFQKNTPRLHKFWMSIGTSRRILKVWLGFSYIYHKIIENRKAVQKMKRDIGQCKNLLSFNRDELRRLWLELVEQRRSLELIEIIDRIKSAPEILKNLISAKAWPEATEYLIRTVEIMSKEVEHVPALDAVKSEISAKKKVIIIVNLIFPTF